MFGLTKKKKPIEVGEYKPVGELNQNSPTWIFVKDWAEKELEKLRIKNDSITLSETQTAVVRGQIKRLKAVIDLPNEETGILRRFQNITGQETPQD